MKYFLTSDTHFSHFNIINYCNRPFKTLEEMDNTIINRWNERVSKEDTVFFLGDFSFKSCKEAPEGKAFEYFKSKLNGNIIFIEGNHDKKGRNGLHTKIQGMFIKHGNITMYLCHDAKNAIGKYNLVGHIHEKKKFWKVEDKYFINIGVDVWQFYPVNLDTIINKYYRFNNIDESIFIN